MGSNAESMRKTIETLMKCSVKLSVNTETLCNASYYLHQFDRSFDCRPYDTDLMAATALYLSAKVTENHLKLRDIIPVFYETIHNTEEPFNSEDKYLCLKESIIDCELLLLRMLRFKVDTRLPHRYLNIYLKALSNWMSDEEMFAKLEASSWALLNDYCCLNPRVLNHKPNQIAISVIELSLQCLEYSIPYNDESLLTWNEAFDESLSKQKIQEICDQITSLYDQSSGSKHSVDRKYVPQKVFDYRSSP